MSNDWHDLLETSDAFERCPECKGYFVELDTHRCGTGTVGGRPNREQRIRMADEDPRPDELQVGVFTRSQGDTYAYHDLGDGEPRCGCTNRTEANAFVTISLGEARRRGRSPCGNCRRIRE